MAREEILVGPLEVYLAPRGEAFPLIDAAPAGNWELQGASGDENYTDDGVSVSLPQSIEEFIPAGATMAVKAWRSEESVEVTVTIADTRLVVLAKGLNDNAEVEDAGTREASLYRGIGVAEHALLARGQSPYEDDGDNAGQFQVPVCYVSSEPELVYSKGEPTGVELTFRALLPDAGELADFKVIYSDATAVGA